MLLRIKKIMLWVSSMQLLPCHADIVTDGSLGPRTSLLGPNYEIFSNLGQRVGSNLFHSFGSFNLNVDESAAFTGPTGIENVLARVTGGSASNIDGLISTRFENASPNLFFLNPAGIIFGPNAKLAVQGSFHASTADYLRLDRDKFFYADLTKNSVLSVAPPQAFGFLSNTPALIGLTGGTLQVPAGKTVSLVGGDITVKNGSVYAPGGQINLISTASPGEVTPTLSGPKLEANVTSTQLGKITLSRDANAARPEIEGNEIGDVDASGPVGGAVVIRGGQFVVEEASVLTQTSGGNDGEKGAGIDIRVGILDMHSREKDKLALISTDTTGQADGGDVFVETDTMRLTGAGFCETCFTGIFAQTEGEGDAGHIKVKARQINLETGGTLSTASFAQGEGGDLDVDANNITLDGEATGFTTQSASAGNAGNIDIKANDLTLINGAQIRAFTVGPGRAGDISIRADRIFLSGSSLSGGSSITSETDGAGDAGEINVTTRDLEVRNGAYIIALTAGPGHGGDIFVTADNILLVGSPSLLFTGLSNETQNDGNAGNLTVIANTLEIRDNARIEASTLFDQLTGANLFSGTGGNITVTANDILISGEGAGIFAKSTNNNPAAISGNIHVIANDSLRLENQGKITVETVLADAGDIDIQVNELLLLRNNSSITTSVAGGTGNGGNITLNSVFVVLDERSNIIANALEGQAGNILIRILGGGALFQSPDSLIRASNKFGVEGSVVIDAPDTDIIAGLAGLPANFLDAATALTQLCAERSGANVSSLVFRKYEVLPDSPYALRVQLPRAMPAPRTAKQSRAPRTYYAGSPLPPMISCLGNG